MKQYFTFFKIKFISGLQYRIAALAGLSTQFFFGFVFVMIYMAFFDSNTSNLPMNFTEIVAYIWLGQAFFGLMFIYYKDTELMQMIRDGNIAYELCRPQNLYIKWFTKILSSKLSLVSTRFLPVLFIAYILPSPYNLVFPNGLSSFILFVISLLIGALLITAISTMYHVITFFTLDEKGTLAILSVIADVFAGGIIPVLLLPKFLKIISTYLPFQYIYDLPYRIYFGNISGMNAIFNILIQLIWLIVLVIIGYLLNKKILKNVMVQGG